MVVRARMPKQEDQDIVYYDTRYSVPVFVFFILGILAIILCIYMNGMKLPYIALIFLDFFLFSLFCCVRITADHDFITGSYGIGLFRYEIGIGEVRGFSIKPNRYFTAWLYNPLGQSALQLNFRDGSSKVIPCDDPKKLATFLRLKA